jgi:hypothetical protein
LMEVSSSIYGYAKITTSSAYKEMVNTLYTWKYGSHQSTTPSVFTVKLFCTTKYSDLPVLPLHHPGSWLFVIMLLTPAAFVGITSSRLASAIVALILLRFRLEMAICCLHPPFSRLIQDHALPHSFCSLVCCWSAKFLKTYAQVF